MGGLRKTPAGIWRAFFVGGCLATATIAAPPPAPVAPLAQFGKPDPAKGREALEQLRRQGIAGSYYLEFDLEILPRRGEERTLPGKLWGAQNDDGPISRVEAGQGATAVRLLVQNGARSAAWRFRPGGGIEQLGVSALFEPIVPDTQITAFDLQMPFIFWDDFTYEGLTRFRGRPTHVLVLRPPADFAARYPALKAVRVHLDTQFNALVETELLGAGDKVLKTMDVVDLKKVDELWIPKTFDFRDEETRNKTRFEVTAAALRLDFSPTLFAPAALAEEVRPPAGERLERFAP
ncbi:MAG TPA: outer membrane lipoprotein-sorting protein [Opitutus sp.]|nr:outer membrane lipoprotein-sorting protein [Opitutus sp.]